MRFPADTFARRARRCALLLILGTALTSCASHAPLASAELGAASGAAAANGPAADYPMVIGQPYKVGATLYTPADTMNYDEVGYAAADQGSGVSGSHHTLPLPSYVEVTSLATGRTILVRLERRGPMSGTSVVGLSPTALAQLGASAGDPVRVRRVNPPEEERAALRAGRTAPPRMDTPGSLVAVLKRRLPSEGSATLTAPAAKAPDALAAAAPTQQPPLISKLPERLATVTLPPSAAASQPPVQTVATKPAPSAPQPRTHGAPPPLPPLATGAAPKKDAKPVVVAQTEEPPKAVVPAAVAPPPKKAAVSAAGAYLVQAATMSTLDRAKNVAGAVGGSVSQSGKYYRVRTGPFATREQAEASLAKVRAAGYSDARISTNG